MIRPAENHESDILTALSFASKGYWNYPEEYFDIWRAELTISAAYIRKNDVFVFEEEGVIRGYYSLVELQDDIEAAGARIERGFWLEHMFVDPQHLGRGIGTMLFQHLRKICRFRGIGEVKILADPNAGSFYEKMGCTYQREYPSTIIGRTTPLFHVPIGDHCPTR